MRNSLKNILIFPFANLKRYILLINILIMIFYSHSFAQNDTLFISSDSINAKQLNLGGDASWRYHPGDNLDWAQPNFNDSAWDTINPWMDMLKFDANKWEGIGWFRKVVQIDSALINTCQGVFIHHDGASEIFLNGKKIFTFGKVGKNCDDEELFDPIYAPFVFNFDTSLVYTIAIRYSNHNSCGSEYFYNKFFGHIGFSISLFNFNSNIDNEIGQIKEFSSSTWGLFVFNITFSILFFLLYFFYIKNKENLFFAFFMLGISLSFISIALEDIGHVALELIALFRMIRFVGVSVSFISLLLFLYEIVYKRIIKIFWIFLIAFLITNLTAFVLKAGIFDYMVPLMIVVGILLIESTRVMIVGVRNNIENIRLIASGGLLFVLLLLTGFIVSLIIEQPPEASWYYILLFDLPFISFPISMAIYLAKSYANTNNNLEAQINTVKELSEKQIEQERKNAELKLQAELERKESERKSKELDEARKLQLSMLPQEVPQLPNLDISAYMKTSTEVGGDYYDFYVSENGTLTAIIADATGHGMQAGMMVTATKSLFQNLSGLPDLEDMFHQINTCLFSMELQPLLMSLLLIRINGKKLEVINGGMPNLLIYKNKSNTIEEIASVGPPLGAYADFSYKKISVEIESGDVTLSMSDGFAERFNDNEEMFGYKRCKNIFKEVVNKPCSEIIDCLNETGQDWAGSREQGDDITFVTLKCK